MYYFKYALIYHYGTLIINIIINVNKKILAGPSLSYLQHPFRKPYGLPTPHKQSARWTRQGAIHVQRLWQTVQNQRRTHASYFFQMWNDKKI